ncbi:MAG: biopolymer transporter ExbD [candidate division WOR-3 bacterium]
MRKFTLKRPAPEIPTASTADIAFLLIIFFMLTTVLRTEYGLKVNLPTAESTERILKRKNIVHIWVDKTRRISIDDNLLEVSGITTVMQQKILDNPELISEVLADKEVDYGRVNDILEALKEAGAFKILFATEYEEGG